MDATETKYEDQMPGALPRSVGILIAILVSLVLVFLVAQGTHVPPQAQARLCNATGSELYDVSFKGHGFGRLAIGATTAVVTFDGLFAEESVVVKMNGNVLKNILEDHVGDKWLAPGAYTFVLVPDELAMIRAKLSPSGQCPLPPNSAFQPTPTARLN